MTRYVERRNTVEAVQWDGENLNDLIRCGIPFRYENLNLEVLDRNRDTYVHVRTFDYIVSLGDGNYEIYEGWKFKQKYEVAE